MIPVAGIFQPDNPAFDAGTHAPPSSATTAAHPQADEVTLSPAAQALQHAPADTDPPDFKPLASDSLQVKLVPDLAARFDPRFLELPLTSEPESTEDENPAAPPAGS
jgi:hypothetical protein